MDYWAKSFCLPDFDCHYSFIKGAEPSPVWNRVNLYMVLYWYEWSTDQKKNRCQCQFNSYVKNSKLCNNLTYKGFTATQKLTFISFSASWCCVNKAAACVLSHCTHSVKALFLCIAFCFCGFCKLTFSFCFCEYMIISFVSFGSKKGQQFWRNHLGS